MDSFTSMVYRQLSCGAAAALITLILSVTFVQSTSLPAGAHASAPVFVQVQPRHAARLLGLPEPAVLVD